MNKHTHRGKRLRLADQTPEGDDQSSRGRDQTGDVCTLSGANVLVDEPWTCGRRRTGPEPWPRVSETRAAVAGCGRLKRPFS